VADIAHLEQQLIAAEQRTVDLGKPAEDAEKEWRSAIKQQEAEQNQGGVSEPTRVRAEKAEAKYLAAVAAENTARNKARDLRAQYDSARRAERPAAPATGPRVYAVADIERLKQQLSAANERMVELNEQAHLAEAKLDSAVKQQTEEEQNQGRVSAATQDLVAKARAEYSAAEAAEKKALREARDLGAQYDSARRAAPPAAEPSPHAPEATLAAEHDFSSLEKVAQGAIAEFNNQKALIKLGERHIDSYGDALIELDRALDDLYQALNTATPEQIRAWKPEIERLRADLENSVWHLGREAYTARDKIRQEMAKPENQRSIESIVKWGDIIGKYEQVTREVKNEPAKSLTDYVQRLMNHWGKDGVRDIALSSPRDPLGEAASRKMMELEAARMMPEQDGKGALVLERLNEARDAIGKYYDAVKSAAKYSPLSDRVIKRDELALSMLINEYRLQSQQLEVKPNHESSNVADGLLDQRGELDLDQTVPADPHTQQMAGEDGKSDGPKPDHAAPPAGESPPHAPEALAAENLPGGLSREIERLEEKIGWIEKRLKDPSLVKWKQDVLNSQLTAARKDFGVAKTRCDGLKAEAASLHRRIEQIQEREAGLHQALVDRSYDMDRRIAASKALAELQGELDEPLRKWRELLRKIDGPETGSSGPAPNDPHVGISTTGDAHLTGLEKLQAEIERAHAEMAKITRELLELGPSEARRRELLMKFDVQDKISRESTAALIKLDQTKYDKDRDDAFEDYRRFKSDRGPLSVDEYVIVLGEVPNQYVTSTEGMSASEALAAMKRKMRLLDNDMVLANVRREAVPDQLHRGPFSQGEAQEKIKSAADELNKLMTFKMALENSIAILEKQVRDKNAN
jgi:hypothetical protein